MNPIDPKARLGDRYRIGQDEAADHETGGRHDPWLYTIPCRYGHIYPHSDRLLAVYCDRRGVLSKLRWIEGLIPHQIGDDEAIYLFEPERFDAVAAVVHPRRRRRLSEKHRAALLRGGSDHRFQGQSHGSKCEQTEPESLFSIHRDPEGGLSKRLRT